MRNRSIFMAISSEGSIAVFNMLLECTSKEYIHFTLTNGFVTLNGRVQRISQAAKKLFKEKWFVLELNQIKHTKPF